MSSQYARRIQFKVMSALLHHEHHAGLKGKPEALKSPPWGASLARGLGPTSAKEAGGRNKQMEEFFSTDK